MRICLPFLIILFLQLCSSPVVAQPENKGALLYANELAAKEDTTGWRMEGAGALEFKNGWMQMHSPNQKGHHVFWCPRYFPANFIAEWEVQNLHPEAGLCIIFFAAKGLDGEDIFSPSLPKRNGVFKQYTNGAINNCHISNYANSPDEPERETSNLRKNPGFHKVQAGEQGIPAHSTAIHQLQLIKQEGRIRLLIDGRKVIDWQDNGLQFGGILQGGKIGFRQMKWTQFAYRKLKIWECLPQKDTR